MQEHSQPCRIFFIFNYFPKELMQLDCDFWYYEWVVDKILKTTNKLAEQITASATIKTECAVVLNQIATELCYMMNSVYIIVYFVFSDAAADELTSVSYYDDNNNGNINQVFWATPSSICNENPHIV